MPETNSSPALPWGREYYGPDAHALAECFHLMAGDGKSFALLLRYQSQADRQYRRAVEDLERLQSQREDSPNEPISIPQPQQTKPELTSDPEPASGPEPTPIPTTTSQGPLCVSVPLCQGPPLPTHEPPQL